MERKRVMSLGNGCESKEFFKYLNIDDKGPFDGNLCSLGPVGIDTFLNGEFIKAIQTGDVRPSNPTIPPELEFVNEHNASNSFPIVTCNGVETCYPHITYSSFMKHINDRIQHFQEQLNNPNQVFTITNGQRERFWYRPLVFDFVNRYYDLLHNRIVVISAYVDPVCNYFHETDFPCIDLGEHSIIFEPFPTKAEKQKIFYNEFEKFCQKWPETASKIILPTI